MTVPVIGSVDFGGPQDAPLLIVGPSLGTSVTALWSAAAQRLATHHRVIGFDLPGHGCSPAPVSGFTVADVAAAVHDIATTHSRDRYHYAGVSAGGAIGLQLLLQHGDSIATAALICTGARIRSSAAWLDRARVVRRNGPAAMLGPAITTWFADKFTERDPATAEELLQSLRDTDAEGYAATCEALAQFDVRRRLGSIANDVIAIAGSQDVATPPRSLLFISEHIPGCRYLELAETAHLAPAEQPDLIAEELLASTQRSLL